MIVGTTRLRQTLWAGMRGREKVRLERVVDQYMLDHVNKKTSIARGGSSAEPVTGSLGSKAIACTKI
jgi:hypothetical protein